jgi:hypothetical protein
MCLKIDVQRMGYFGVRLELYEKLTYDKRPAKLEIK